MVKKSSKHNFNLYALNTILGLQKGSSELSPFSNEFAKFRYDCFSIERDHSISSKGKLKPEIILCSTKINNCLLFESTTADASYKSTSKKEKEFSQIERYRSIEKSRLINVAAFPKNSVDTHDVVFIMPDHVFDGYLKYFDENEIGFPILEFNYSKEEQIYSLEKKHNNFSIKEVDKFFSQKITFKRVPKFIQVDISNLNNSKRKFFELVALNLLTILYKGKQNDIFSHTEIAKKIIRPNVWKLLSIENKKNAERLTSSFIEQLLVKYPLIKAKYFQKEKKHFNYKIVLPDRQKEFELNKIHKRILQFAKEEADPNSNPQLSLEI